jgi:toxin HigB-1
VYIYFGSRRLEEAASSFDTASRTFGVPIGRKYIQRLALLRAADKFSQLYGFQALRFHQLKGGREGQYSIFLTQNFRFIIEKIDNDKIRIVNVEDYHGT